MREMSGGVNDLTYIVTFLFDFVFNKQILQQVYNAFACV